MAVLRRRRGGDRRVRRRRQEDRRQVRENRIWLTAITIAVIYGWWNVGQQNRTIQANRVNQSGLLCRVLNEKVEKPLRVLIVQGTVASKAFEELYRAHGAPAYSARAKQGAAAAESLANLDCVALQGAVKSNRELRDIPTVTVDPRELEPLQLSPARAVSRPVPVH